MPGDTELLAVYKQPSPGLLNKSSISKGRCARLELLKHDLTRKNWSTQRCQPCEAAFRTLLRAYEYDGTWDDPNAPNSSVAVRELPRTRGAHETDRITLHESWTVVESFALIGCTLCRLIRQRFLLIASSHELGALSTPVVVRRRRKKSSISLWPSEVVVEVGQLSTRLFEIHAYSQEHTFRPDFINQNPSPLFLSCRGHEAQSYTAGDDRGGRIACISDCLQFWLDLCRHKHNRCRHGEVLLPAEKTKSWVIKNHNVSRPQPFLPTRLVFIQKTDRGQITVKLVEKADIFNQHKTSFNLGGLFGPKRVEYTALSYAWGSGGEFSLTTRANYEERCQSIDLQSLARTFRDAIQLTCELGISYVWIDCFCIVQPTKEDNFRADWNHEVTLMPEIYRNASLTIAAASAPSVHDGCVFHHDDRDYPVYPCNIDDLCGGNSAITGSVWVSPEVPPWTDYVSKSSLSKRGWCFQERLLSTRTAFLTTKGVFWECQELEASEYHPSGLEFFSRRQANSVESRMTLDKSFPFIHMGSYTIPKRESAPSLEYDASSSLWKSISDDEITTRGWLLTVENLSARSFTRPEDKLNAFLGIAKVVFARIEAKDHYLAGLWRSSICRGLAWHTCALQEESADLPKSKGRIEIVPSWSWASVRHTVRFPFEHDDTIEAVEGKVCLHTAYTNLITVENLVPDPVAQSTGVSHGRLTLRGKTISFTCQSFDLPEHFINLEALDQSIYTSPESRQTRLRNQFQIDQRNILYLDTDDVIERIRTQDLRELRLKCLRIIGTKYMRQGWVAEAIEPSSQGFLVLEPAGDNDVDRSIYRRVGWLEREMILYAPIGDDRRGNWWQLLAEEGHQEEVTIV